MSDIRCTTSALNTSTAVFPVYRGKDVGNVNVTYVVVSVFLSLSLFLARFCVRLHRGSFILYCVDSKKTRLFHRLPMQTSELIYF